jgi:hypothetical protein
MPRRAGVSLVASGTSVADLFVKRNNSRVDVENAYLGVRWQGAQATSVGLTAGRQP